ncbi:MAG: FliG C-terminal domain-containing protein [Sedimentisphaerales bacterium]|nr:FliG C-terminal domain-containing protein [Sedimentisphaerales bacterium]
MPDNEYHISSRKSLRRRKKANACSLRTYNKRPEDAKKLLTGKQKAAMLLMSLDSKAAAELLKDVDAEAIQELAVELAHLDAAGFTNNRQDLGNARQSCKPSYDFRINGFLKEVLKSSVGNEKTEQIQTGIQELLYKNDPFQSLCSAKPKTVAAILENEHPQTAAVVLAEMPAESKTEVLRFLDWGIRISIVNRMSDCRAMSAQAKSRITEAVCKRLEAVTDGQTNGSMSAQSKPSIRKMAIILRNMGKEIRDSLLGFIRGKDKHAGEIVTDLMIFWEDILLISDRSLQKALRRIDMKKLALALVRADNQLIQKIKSNISETMNAVLNEQMLLMSAYGQDDIEQAREDVVDILRKMHEKCELTFMEEWCDI